MDKRARIVKIVEKRWEINKVDLIEWLLDMLSDGDVEEVYDEYAMMDDKPLSED
tara:strand:+ start:242 stop:403 length:162 start_codon:yes stop_codon:yes gene_type:complete